MVVKKHILKKFMYNESLKFNEILDKAFPSNKFDYHLKQLVGEGLIIKKNNLYSLTNKGTQVISSIDGVNIEDKRKPISCVFILGYDEEKDLVLLNQRKKQPFMNVVGVPGGKIEFGQSIRSQAKDEFFEETGLVAKNMDLKLITNYRTVDECSGELSHHVIGFFFLATGLSGELIEKNREGLNMFVKLSDTKNMKKYPDFDFFTSELLKNKSCVKFQEVDRFISNGEFSKIKFL